MPAAISYPGVYVEEIPSGVRPIVGVSTSVTAFVGAAARGPLNKAVRLQSFADYERRFGELHQDSEMSYAIRQFFRNGGSEAWAIRIAENAVAATKELKNAAGDNVLRLTALDSGKVGEQIQIAVDHRSDSPGSHFNVVLSLIPPDGAGEPVIETHRNLSMNSRDPRYAPVLITQNSTLVRAERITPLPGGLAGRQGSSTSGDLAAVADLTTLVDGTHNTLRISLDGQAPVQIVLDPIAANTNASLRTAIRSKAQAALGAANVEVTVDTTGGVRKLVITSQTNGEFSRVRVLPGDTRDAASRLKLGPLFGGLEEDAVALIRPAEVPEPAVLLGGVIAAAADIDNIPSAHKTFQIVLDNYVSEITLDGADLAGALAARLADVAARITAKVRQSKRGNPAFENFTATVRGGNQLELRSGTRGGQSAVAVRAVSGDALATALRLTEPEAADISKAIGKNVTLEGGNESSFDPNQSYHLFIGNRAQREGIYALDAVDLFNLMVLSGVTDPGILTDAAVYCQERRAFLIVDSPANVTTPSQMETTATGTQLPKTNYAAVYFPWLRIRDPLRPGQFRTVPPSGTIAGLYARTDTTRGVWKAPAGTEANLVGAEALEYKMSDPENGVLNPRGVNCLRIFPSFGAVSWGARTLHGDDQLTSEWKYIPVRRLALFLEESLYRGTKWAVFEPNDEPLWAQLRLNIGAFLQDLFRQGAFAGASPRDAYFVKCDGDTTTASDRDKGIVNILIGFAPLKPAEFVILKFQQITRPNEA